MRTKRRISIGAIVSAVMAAGLIAAYLVFAPIYPRHPYLSGWVLFALMLVLTFFNLRKKVPFLRLGSASFWLRMHINLGLFSAVLFLAHMSWSWPGGIFHQLLAGCYVVVFLSGMIGWWMSRSFPKMLTIAGYETPYERIPFARVSLREEAEALVLAGTDGQTSPVTADFYTGKLGMFFAEHRNRWAHLRQSRAPQKAHLSQFSEIERYSTKGDREILAKLKDLVARKHMLDYQYSLQSSLRLWLFVHIPLSYSLLIFSVLHIILVHAFSGAVT